MNEIGAILDNEILPLVFEMADQVFPEFNFKRHGDKWINTNGLKVDGSHGETGKVYYYQDRPYQIKDYTRGNLAVTSYLENRDGKNWFEVVKYLAGITGVQLPEKPTTQEEREKYQSQQDRSNLLEAINDYFKSQLLENPEAKKVKEYLYNRGYQSYIPQNKDELHLTEKMELGYIPSQDELKSHLKDLGKDSFMMEDLFPKAVGNTHQITIPLRCNGRIVCFCFRRIDEERPKYSYTKNERNSYLFGLNRASKENSLVLVEGVLDALHLQALGFNNAASLGGISLNQNQIELIKRAKYKNIILCLDNDKTGEKATHSIINKNTISFDTLGVFVAQINGFKDPDELINTKGLEAFKNVIDNAKSSSIYKLEAIKNRISKCPTDLEYCQALEEIGVIEKSVKKTPEKKTFQAISNALIKKWNTERTSSFLNNTALDKDWLKPATQDGIRKLFQEETSSFDSGYLINNENLTFPSGSYSLVAGKTGGGKTTVLLNFAINAMMNSERKVAIFTYEESSYKLIIKLLNIYVSSKIGEFAKNHKKAISGYYKDESSEFLTEKHRQDFINYEKEFYSKFIDTGRIMVIDTQDDSNELIEKIKYLNTEKEVDCVLIDYIQRIKYSNTSIARHEQLKNICNDLISCAIETKIPLIAGSQFNRQASNEDPNSLNLDNLGESSGVEFNANMALAVNLNRKTSTIEMIIMKNRDEGIAPPESFDFNGNQGRITAINKTNSVFQSTGKSFKDNKSIQSEAKKYEEATNGD